MFPALRPPASRLRQAWRSSPLPSPIAGPSDPSRRRRGLESPKRLPTRYGRFRGVVFPACIRSRIVIWVPHSATTQLPAGRDGHPRRARSALDGQSLRRSGAGERGMSVRRQAKRGPIRGLDGMRPGLSLWRGLSHVVLGSPAAVDHGSPPPAGTCRRPGRRDQRAASRQAGAPARGRGQPTLVKVE
jgi:hypothetical protein